MLVYICAIVSLNSLKGVSMGDYIGDYIIGVIKGDARSLDSGSYRVKYASGFSVWG